MCVVLVGAIKRVHLNVAWLGFAHRIYYKIQGLVKESMLSFLSMNIPRNSEGSSKFTIFSSKGSTLDDDGRNKNNHAWAHSQQSLEFAIFPS